MKTAPEIPIVWVAAAAALALAGLGIVDGKRPMVADLDLPGQAAQD